MRGRAFPCFSNNLKLLKIQNFFFIKYLDKTTFSLVPFPISPLPFVPTQYTYHTHHHHCWQISSLSKEGSSFYYRLRAFVVVATAALASKELSVGDAVTKGGRAPVIATQQGTLVLGGYSLIARNTQLSPLTHVTLWGQDCEQGCTLSQWGREC